jgi:hypothetical protein
MKKLYEEGAWKGVQYEWKDLENNIKNYDDNYLKIHKLVSKCRAKGEDHKQLKEFKDLTEREIHLNNLGILIRSGKINTIYFRTQEKNILQKLQEELYGKGIYTEGLDIIAVDPCASKQKQKQNNCFHACVLSYSSLFENKKRNKICVMGFK